MTSVQMRSEGSGAKMYVLRTMNSLRMSFWMVPLSCSLAMPRSWAATIKAARTGSTAPFMVIDTETRSSAMPSNRSSMSSTLSMATPALPTSALQ
ncbi:hypothetical protein D3C76_1556990 [compost metagenome]